MGNSSKLKARARPQQTRSRETLEKILDETERVMLQKGISAINTNNIAERSEIRVSTLYHYFPNKQSMLAAVVQRALDELELQWDAVGPPDVHTDPIDDYVSWSLDKIADTWQRRQGAMLIWSAVRKSPDFEDMSDRFVNLMAQYNADLVKLYYPGIRPKRRSLIGLAVEEATLAMLNTMVALPKKDQAPFLQEIKRMVCLYYRTVADETPDE